MFYESISQLLGLTYIGNEAADRRNVESKIESMLSEIARLRAELAAAKEDSARLDAVQMGSWTIHYRSMNSRWEVLTDHAHPAHRKTYYGQSARAAIDAARKGEKWQK